MGFVYRVCACELAFNRAMSCPEEKMYQWQKYRNDRHKMISARAYPNHSENRETSTETDTDRESDRTPNRSKGKPERERTWEMRARFNIRTKLKLALVLRCIFFRWLVAFIFCLPFFFHFYFIFASIFRCVVAFQVNVQGKSIVALNMNWLSCFDRDLWMCLHASIQIYWF